MNHATARTVVFTLTALASAVALAQTAPAAPAAPAGSAAYPVGFGPNPVLPKPDKSLIPTVNVAAVDRWTAQETPRPPLASTPRSKVMRLADGVTAPAFFIWCCMILPLMPLLSSGLGGALFRPPARRRWARYKSSAGGQVACRVLR